MNAQSRAVNRDQLWAEFKKAIDAGSLPDEKHKFRTKRGFNIWLTRYVRKNCCTKALFFHFRTGDGILSCQYNPWIREYWKNGKRSVDFY